MSDSQAWMVERALERDLSPLTREEVVGILRGAAWTRVFEEAGQAPSEEVYDVIERVGLRVALTAHLLEMGEVDLTRPAAT